MTTSFPINPIIQRAVSKRFKRKRKKQIKNVKILTPKEIEKELEKSSEREFDRPLEVRNWK